LLCCLTPLSTIFQLYGGGNARHCHVLIQNMKALGLKTKKHFPWQRFMIKNQLF